MEPTTAILASAGIGGLSSIFGGNSAKKASKRAIREQRRQFDLSRQDMLPFLERGNEASSRLWELLQNPDYVRNLAQSGQQYGIDALDSSAAARGLYGSTGHMGNIADYAARNFSDANESYMNRLAALSGTGQTASNNLANLGSTYATNVGNAQQNLGNARASTYLGVGNAANNALNQYMYGQGAGLFNPYGPSTGTYNAYQSTF